MSIIGERFYCTLYNLTAEVWMESNVVSTNTTKANNVITHRFKVRFPHSSGGSISSWVGNYGYGGQLRLMLINAKGVTTYDSNLVYNLNIDSSQASGWSFNTDYTLWSHTEEWQTDETCYQKVVAVGQFAQQTEFALRESRYIYQICVPSLSASKVNTSQNVNVYTGRTKNVTNTLQMIIGGTPYTVATKTQASPITINSASIANSQLYPKFTTTTLPVTLKLYTYSSGGALLGERDITLTYTPVMPTLTTNKTSYNASEILTYNANNKTSLRTLINFRVGTGAWFNVTPITDDENHSFDTSVLYQKITTKSTETLEIYSQLITAAGVPINTYSKKVTINIVNSNPSFVSTIYEDINPLTLAITGNNQNLIKSNSTLKITFQDVSYQNYASAGKYNIKMGATTYSFSTNPVTLPSNAINDVNPTIEAFITDSRGLKSNTINIVPAQVYNYEPPRIEDFKIDRNLGGTGPTVILNASLYYSALCCEKDSVTLACQYKATDSEGDFQETGLLVGFTGSECILTDFSIPLTFDTNKPYYFNLVLSDGIGTIVLKSAFASSSPACSVGENSVGMGCVAPDDEEPGVALKIVGDLKLNGGIVKGGKLLWSNSSGIGANGALLIPEINDYSVFKAVIVNASGGGAGGDIILTKRGSYFTGGCLYLSPTEARLYTYYLTMILSGTTATVKYCGLSSLLPALSAVSNTMKVTEIWGIA